MGIRHGCYTSDLSKSITAQQPAGATPAGGINKTVGGFRMRDREKVALQMMQDVGATLIRINIARQTEIIIEALDFADTFLAISRQDDEEEK